jgi:O-acetyl-ADP-ribose deacetylase
MNNNGVNNTPGTSTSGVGSVNGGGNSSATGGLKITHTNVPGPYAADRSKFQKTALLMSSTAPASTVSLGMDITSMTQTVERDSLSVSHADKGTSTAGTVQFTDRSRVIAAGNKVFAIKDGVVCRWNALRGRWESLRIKKIDQIRYGADGNIHALDKDNNLRSLDAKGKETSKVQLSNYVLEYSASPKGSIAYLSSQPEKGKHIAFLDWTQKSVGQFAWIEGPDLEEEGDPSQPPYVSLAFGNDGRLAVLDRNGTQWWGKRISNPLVPGEQTWDWKKIENNAAPVEANYRDAGLTPGNRIVRLVTLPYGTVGAVDERGNALEREELPGLVEKKRTDGTLVQRYMDKLFRTRFERTAEDSAQAGTVPLTTMVNKPMTEWRDENHWSVYRSKRLVRTFYDQFLPGPRGGFNVVGLGVAFSNQNSHTAKAFFKPAYFERNHPAQQFPARFGSWWSSFANPANAFRKRPHAPESERLRQELQNSHDILVDNRYATPRLRTKGAGDMPSWMEFLGSKIDERVLENAGECLDTLRMTLGLPSLAEDRNVKLKGRPLPDRGGVQPGDKKLWAPQERVQSNDNVIFVLKGTAASLFGSDHWVTREFKDLLRCGVYMRYESGRYLVDGGARRGLEKHFVKNKFAILTGKLMNDFAVLKQAAIYASKPQLAVSVAAEVKAQSETATANATSAEDKGKGAEQGDKLKKKVTFADDDKIFKYDPDQAIDEEASEGANVSKAESEDIDFAREPDIAKLLTVKAQKAALDKNLVTALYGRDFLNADRAQKSMNTFERYRRDIADRSSGLYRLMTAQGTMPNFISPSEAIPRFVMSMNPGEGIAIPLNRGGGLDMEGWSQFLKMLKDLVLDWGAVGVQVNAVEPVVQTTASRGYTFAITRTETGVQLTYAKSSAFNVVPIGAKVQQGIGIHATASSTVLFAYAGVNVKFKGGYEARFDNMSTFHIEQDDHGRVQNVLHDLFEGRLSYTDLLKLSDAGTNTRTRLAKFSGSVDIEPLLASGAVVVNPLLDRHDQIKLILAPAVLQLNFAGTFTIGRSSVWSAGKTHSVQKVRAFDPTVHFTLILVVEGQYSRVDDVEAGLHRGDIIQGGRENQFKLPAWIMVMQKQLWGRALMCNGFMMHFDKQGRLAGASKSMSVRPSKMNNWVANNELNVNHFFNKKKVPQLAKLMNDYPQHREKLQERIKEMVATGGAISVEMELTPEALIEAQRCLSESGATHRAGSEIANGVALTRDAQVNHTGALEDIIGELMKNPANLRIVSIGIGGGNAYKSGNSSGLLLLRYSDFGENHFSTSVANIKFGYIESGGPLPELDIDIEGDLFLQNYDPVEEKNPNEEKLDELTMGVRSGSPRADSKTTSMDEREGKGDCERLLNQQDSTLARFSPIVDKLYATVGGSDKSANSESKWRELPMQRTFAALRSLNRDLFNVRLGTDDNQWALEELPPKKVREALAATMTGSAAQSWVDMMRSRHPTVKRNADRARLAGLRTLSSKQLCDALNDWKPNADAQFVRSIVDTARIDMDRVSDSIDGKITGEQFKQHMEEPLAQLRADLEAATANPDRAVILRIGHDPAYFLRVVRNVATGEFRCEYKNPGASADADFLTATLEEAVGGVLLLHDRAIDDAKAALAMLDPKQLDSSMPFMEHLRKQAQIECWQDETRRLIEDLWASRNCFNILTIDSAKAVEIDTNSPPSSINDDEPDTSTSESKLLNDFKKTELTSIPEDEVRRARSLKRTNREDRRRTASDSAATASSSAKKSSLFGKVRKAVTLTRAVSIFSKKSDTVYRPPKPVEPYCGFRLYEPTGPFSYHVVHERGDTDETGKKLDLKSNLCPVESLIQLLQDRAETFGITLDSWVAFMAGEGGDIDADGTPQAEVFQLETYASRLPTPLPLTTVLVSPQHVQSIGYVLDATRDGFNMLYAPQIVNSTGGHYVTYNRHVDPATGGDGKWYMLDSLNGEEVEVGIDGNALAASFAKRAENPELAEESLMLVVESPADSRNPLLQWHQHMTSEIYDLCTMALTFASGQPQPRYFAFHGRLPDAPRPLEEGEEPDDAVGGNQSEAAPQALADFLAEVLGLDPAEAPYVEQQNGIGAEGNWLDEMSKAIDDVLGAHAGIVHFPEKETDRIVYVSAGNQYSRVITLKSGQTMLLRDFLAAYETRVVTLRLQIMQTGKQGRVPKVADLLNNQRRFIAVVLRGVDPSALAAGLTRADSAYVETLDKWTPPVATGKSRSKASIALGSLFTRKSVASSAASTSTSVSTSASQSAAVEQTDRIVELQEVKTPPGQIGVQTGDVTKVKAGGVVNAANTTMAGGGGVDGDIHHAAGPEMKKELTDKKRGKSTVPIGHPLVTRGHGMPVDRIVHVAVPALASGAKPTDEQRRQYREAVSNAIDTFAVEHLMDETVGTSLVLSMLGMGAYNWSAEDAAAEMVAACKEMIEQRHGHLAITLMPYERDPKRAEVEQALNNALAAAGPISPKQPMKSDETTVEIDTETTIRTETHEEPVQVALTDTTVTADHVEDDQTVDAWIAKYSDSTKTSDA